MRSPRPSRLKGGLENLNIRWLGKVDYEVALELQRGLFSGNSSISPKNYLLLLEHPPVYTLGARGNTSHLLFEPGVGETAGNSKNSKAKILKVDRGGDVTFHGPGQLVGYPILSLPSGGSGLVDTVAYVQELEDLLMGVLGGLGIRTTRRQKFPGVWVEGDFGRPRKIASVGVKLIRGRTMHGFALNVSTDLEWFNRIVPCGIADVEMTSIKGELGEKWSDESVAEIAELVAGAAIQRWGNPESFNWTKARHKKPSRDFDGSESSPSYDYTSFYAPSDDDISDGDINVGVGKNILSITSVGINVSKGVNPNTGLDFRERKPEWLRAPAQFSTNLQRLKKTLKDLPTVCESAGCPNIYECWGEGTATFMINGDRCTRNCRFCLVDTRKPLAIDPNEPARLATAVKEMDLNYVVITAVARDDLSDGGAGGFINSIRAVREEMGAEISVEILIPDFKADPEILDAVFAERPEMLNHNLETVLRLQKQVRPQAGYATSLAVLARAKSAGLVTKSSLMVGLGETKQEMKEALTDLAEVGVDIVTIGQYLRPSRGHLPVDRWWHPDEFAELAELKDALGISHIEAGPLVRSSYRAGKVKSKAELKRFRLPSKS